MYVFVSMCKVGFPFDNGLRSGIIVGGITAPADGILYYIYFSLLKCTKIANLLITSDLCDPLRNNVLNTSIHN